MSNFDSVEKLRERANVSYEDARTALDACGGDLLEALIYLEKQGKVSPPSGGAYSSKPESAHTQTGSTPPPPEKGESFTELMNRFFRWCGRVLQCGNTNHFEVWRYDRKILAVPITVLVLFVLFAPWVTLPLLVIGLFFSFRYSFTGEKVSNIDVNSVMDSAANAADTIKSEVMNTRHDDKR